MWRLLGVASAVDNRRVTDVMVAGWLHAIGDLDYAECEHAIAAHRRESTDYLLPAHVAERVLTERGRRPVDWRRLFVKELCDAAGVSVASLVAGEVEAVAAVRAVADSEGAAVVRVLDEWLSGANVSVLKGTKR